MGIVTTLLLIKVGFKTSLIQTLTFGTLVRIGLIRRKEVPGSYFQYANLNSGLLGEVIERVSGQRFDQFMEHEVICTAQTGSFILLFQVISVRRASENEISGRWDPRGPWYTQADGDASNCFYGMTALDDPEKFLINYP